MNLIFFDHQVNIDKANYQNVVGLRTSTLQFLRSQYDYKLVISMVPCVHEFLNDSMARRHMSWTLYATLPEPENKHTPHTIRRILR